MTLLYRELKQERKKIPGQKKKNLVKEFVFVWGGGRPAAKVQRVSHLVQGSFLLASFILHSCEWVEVERFLYL